MANRTFLLQRRALSATRGFNSPKVGEQRAPESLVSRGQPPALTSIPRSRLRLFFFLKNFKDSVYLLEAVPTESIRTRTHAHACVKIKEPRGPRQRLAPRLHVRAVANRTLLIAFLL